MSERTLRVLMHARVTLSCELVFARLEKRTRLESIASALPGQLAAVARAELELEADMDARARIPDPLRESELSEATAEVAARIRAGIDDVQWPTPEDGFDVISTPDVAAAVYGFLAGCVEPLERLVLRHARPDRDARTVRRILAPRPFFDPGAFTALAGLLNLVSAAQLAVEDAQRAHDAAVRADAGEQDG
jgi:hypothetical protein